MRTRPLLFAIAFVATGVPAQGEGARPLIRWQRTLADAVRLAKAKKLPLLVVANQDNELACDSLANDRYRSPEFSRLANRYVAVIGSVFRHNPRDHDDQGRRIPCPRFGCVTCGEHIAMEPQLFERFFKGQRTAPRHIGIGVDGKELFDRFLDTDLRAIDDALRQNADQGRPEPDLRAGASTVDALVRSCDQADRTALEDAFAAADGRGRAAILATAERGGIPHPDLARLALATGDVALRAAAVANLRATATPDCLDVLLRGLGTARSQQEHDGLMQALERASKDDETCRKALTIRRALSAPARIRTAVWSKRLGGAAAGDPEVVTDEEILTLEKRIEANIGKARAGDPGGALSFQVATDTFRFALNRLQQQKDPTFLLQDALAAAERAVKAGYPAAGAAGLRARACFMLNRMDDAQVFAAAALGDKDGAGPLVADAASPTAGQVLEIYARHYLAKTGVPAVSAADYPVEAIREAHAALSVLAVHPSGTEALADAHIRLLSSLEAWGAAGVAIRQAVRRYPGSNQMHQYYREQVRWEGGARALAAAYDDFEAAPEFAATVDAFAGYACLIAAEDHVRNKDLDAASAAYRKAVLRLDRSVAANPEFKAWSSHYAALAHGGLARLALDAERYAEAVDAALTGARTNTAAFEKEDGLRNTLKRTSTRLRRRLREAPELRAKLDEGLKAVGLDG